MKGWLGEVADLRSGYLPRGLPDWVGDCNVWAEVWSIADECYRPVLVQSDQTRSRRIRPSTIL